MSEGDTRKRPGDSEMENDKKRYNRGPQNVNVKLLVPTISAGAIMGKGGENITKLKQELEIGIKISKLNDFYPGTQDRVCLISGKDVSSVMQALNFVLDKIYTSDQKSQENEHKVKFVIANSTAGMIIGKEGADIKQLKDDSGCSFLAISKKDMSSVPYERFLTIVGDQQEIEHVLQVVLEKIESDPHHGQNLTISYSGGGGGGGSDGRYDRNGNSGGPFGSGPPSYSNSGFGGGASNAVSPFKSGPYSGGGGGGGLMGSLGLNLKIVLSAQGSATKLSPPVISQLLEHIYKALGNSPYQDKELRDIVNAVGTLANYGLVELGLADMSSHGGDSWQHQQQRSPGSMGRGGSIWERRNK